MRWPTRRRGGRLPSLGQDFDAGHRSYVESLAEVSKLWLKTKPFSAPPNDELGRSLHTFAHIVDRLNLGLRAQILDVGCGPGWLAELLARCGYWVTGIDISEDMVRIAEKRLAEVPRPLGEGVDEPVAEFHAMQVRDLPWTERFDAAILYDTLHHFDDEVETLRVILGSLVPGGRIYIEEGVRPPPGSEAEQTLIEEMRQYGTLESPFDPEYLVEVLEAAGFENVTRFARIDELFEIDSRREAVALLEKQIRYPDLNTIIATKPVGAGTGKDDFRGTLVLHGAPGSYNGNLVIHVEVTNDGRSFWPSASRFPYPHGVVMVGPYLTGPDGGRIELQRTALPHAISPGQAVGLAVVVPEESVTGASEVTIELVREGIAWFSELGSEPLVVSLTDR